jgi:hypothetical protein
VWGVRGRLKPGDRCSRAGDVLAGRVRGIFMGDATRGCHRPSRSRCVPWARKALEKARHRGYPSLGRVPWRLRGQEQFSRQRATRGEIWSGFVFCFLVLVLAAVRDGMALRFIQAQALPDLLRQAGEMGVGGSVLRLFQSSWETVGPLEAEHLGQFADRCPAMLPSEKCDDRPPPMTTSLDRGDSPQAVFLVFF